MHRFRPRWPEDWSDWVPLPPDEFSYRNALDLIAYAEQDPFTMRQTWPDVWHLDSEGRWQCASRGSSLDGVQQFASRPKEMLACRNVSLGTVCPDYWVMLEPRQRWRRERCEVDEHDAACFVTLRQHLPRAGVTLLDVVITDEDERWWSLHEWTTGSTAWTFAPAATLVVDRTHP